MLLLLILIEKERGKDQTEIEESPFGGSFWTFFFLFLFFFSSTAIWCAAPRWNQMNSIHVALHLKWRSARCTSICHRILPLILIITTYYVLLLCLISVPVPPRFIRFFQLYMRIHLDIRFFPRLDPWWPLIHAPPASIWTLPIGHSITLSTSAMLDVPSTDSWGKSMTWLYNGASAGRKDDDNYRWWDWTNYHANRTTGSWTKVFYFAAQG